MSSKKDLTTVMQQNILNNLMKYYVRSIGSIAIPFTLLHVSEMSIVFIVSSVADIIV